MEYLNVHISILRSPQYMGSDPVARATWWNLMGYCAEQENGGRVTGARVWSDRRWQQTCGVTLDEVLGASELMRWEGDDLVVLFYPVEKEEEVRRKREGGRAGGIRSGQARSTPRSIASSSASPLASSTPSSSARSTPSTERKGKEGKGKERKGKKGRVAPLPAVAHAQVVSASQGKPSSQTEVDDYFAELGSTPAEAATFFDHFTANGWKQAGKTAMKDWRAAARNWVRRSMASGLPAAKKSVVGGAAAGVEVAIPDEQPASWGLAFAAAEGGAA